MIYSTIGQYEYFLPYRYSGVSLIVLSALSGVFLYPALPNTIAYEGEVAKIFVSGAIAFVFAWVFLAIMNLTSLCVGLENGDGFNALGDCIAGTILNGVMFLVCAVFGHLVTALVAGKFTADK